MLRGLLEVEAISDHENEGVLDLYRIVSQCCLRSERSCLRPTRPQYLSESVARVTQDSFSMKCREYYWVVFVENLPI